MRIRPLRPEEIPLIVTIHETAARIAYAHIFGDQPFPRNETTKRWRRFGGEILVAEEEDAVVGFVAFDESELHALYVRPGYQRHGIGTQLLASAPSVQRLWVLKENHAARRFYEARGWRAAGAEQESWGVVELLYRREG